MDFSVYSISINTSAFCPRSRKNSEIFSTALLSPISRALSQFPIFIQSWDDSLNCPIAISALPFIMVSPDEFICGFRGAPGRLEFSVLLW